MPKFTKAERLLKHAEFEAVYKNGRRISVKGFWMVFLPGERRRLGITVGSKVGMAHVRVRIKRIVREFFRLNKDRFPMGDIVITAREGAGRLTNEEVRRQLQSMTNVKI